MRILVVALMMCALGATAMLAADASLGASPGAGEGTATPSTAVATASAVPSMVNTPVPGLTPVDDEGNPLPPTFAPPTPTPKLPEEGGPAGGVLGGHIYVDVDGDKTQSERDTPSAQSQVDVYTPGDGGFLRYITGVRSDESGRWEVRALPDGIYHVLWSPSLRDASLRSKSVPPPESILVGPNQTVEASVRVVQIRGASRTLDIDFLAPLEPPVPGQSIALPATGARDPVESSWITAAFFGAAIALGLGAGITLRRRAR